MTPLRLESGAPRSEVKHSTTEPLRSLFASLCFYFYAPNFEKVEKAYCFGLERPSVQKISKGFLNFIGGFLIKTDPYFVLF